MHAMYGLHAEARNIAEQQWIDGQLAGEALYDSNQNSQINWRIFLSDRRSEIDQLLVRRGENSARISAWLAQLQTRVGSEQGQESPREQDWLQITIQDTGCGIPSAIQSRIFDPYLYHQGTGKGHRTGTRFGLRDYRQETCRNDLFRHPRRSGYDLHDSPARRNVFQ